LFRQDRPCDLRERQTAGDRCEPLGSDGVWTKRGPDQTQQVAGDAALQQQAPARAVAGVRWSLWLLAQESPCLGDAWR
jgi:hypothetical protein